MEREALGAAIKRRRESLGITQAQLAERLAVHKQTVVKYEAGDIDISGDRLRSVCEALDISLSRLLDGALSNVGQAHSGDDAAGWSPNPALRTAVPPRAYEAALGYLRRLERVRLPADQIEDAERMLLDPRAGKLNKRVGELTEDDWVELIDARWRIVAEVLSWSGVRP